MMEDTVQPQQPIVETVTKKRSKAPMIIIGILLIIIGALSSALYFVYTNQNLYAVNTQRRTITQQSMPVLQKIRGWNIGTTLPDVVYNAMTKSYTASNGTTYVYEMAGYDPTVHSTTNAVYYTKISPDGSLGKWQTTSPLPQGLRAADSVLYSTTSGAFLYVIGGEYDDENRLYNNKVYMTTIQSDGSLSSWQTISTLPVSIYDAKDVLYNGYVYIIGGWTGEPSARVYYAKIQPDGTFDVWQTTSLLPVPLASEGVVVVPTGTNAYIYTIGGNTDIYNNSKNIPSVYVAETLPDGELTPWQETENYPVGISEQVVNMYQKNNQTYLISMGGFINGSWGSAIFVTTVHQDGTLDPWVQAPHLLAKQIASSSTFSFTSPDATYVYTLGGGSSSLYNGGINDVYYISVDSLLPTLSPTVTPTSTTIENGFGSN